MVIVIRVTVIGTRLPQSSFFALFSIEIRIILMN